ncbi:UDP-3-O-[3-hydroxymyristoyl] glucosamine N-acyltransferase [Desulfobotulus alkaliphilus]|uniref:UDP-3-O-acylglucosamine N-acyltransferase n=1 Tax=Desulfobotulus alkaliphilus TaxID=622671 RepID=A0A562RIJ8_9BACT|nr:UDP-3-O-(3-hydroxymyristoyl)glucosamine N-acyltransferase [Desulfobotulus alkaliphilus]TWI68160.1 UDP-3-O-[3-hydroxymyristoyl] glucosamine N-acyltransferase [Desulfobotulus alkaliphilus]
MKKKVTLADLADICKGRVLGDPDFEVRGIAPLENAGPEDLSLAMNAKYLRQAASSRAGALIVGEGVQEKLFEGNYLISDAPYWAFAKILQFFHPDPAPCNRIHPSTFVGDNFTCKGNLFTDAFVVIGQDVEMGEDCRIGANSVIGDACVLGDGCVIYPNVTLYPGTRLGNRVRIHSGSVIGSDGFGFAPRQGSWEKIPHLGSVELGDDVEIGAGCTLDRGTFGYTRIGNGVKLDDQVHIGHNVQIGENTLLVAQVGIAGSSQVGKNSILAGKVGVSGHIRIGDCVQVGPMAGVAHDVADGQVVSGAPEMPHRQWLKVQRILPRLPEMRRRIAALERKLGMDAKEGTET